MRTVLIHVEGPTEENFVKVVLTKHLHKKNLHPQPIINSTKRLISGLKFKGGITAFPKIERELRGLLRASNAVAVTTMYDFYALPGDFPGMDEIAQLSKGQRVAHLETAFKNHINDPRFIPYLQVHEFEAILFADSAPFRQYFGAVVADGVAAIANSVNSPEEINDQRDTSPSHRLANLIDGYDKASDGPLLADEIPLDCIRAKCPHFNQWLSILETL